MTTWGMLIDLKRCAGCGACVVACQLQNNQSPGVSWVKLDTVEWGEEAGEAGRAYLPHACMHCDNPECVAVCPTGASQKLDDGVVVVEYDACIACGYCMSACPYGARVLNEGKGNYFGEYAQAPYEAYGTQDVEERHRHRYEVNNVYRDELEQSGMLLCGISPDKRIVEMVEIPDHPWFVGCQFHPEFKSRPNRPHPLFSGFVGAAVKYSESK